MFSMPSDIHPLKTVLALAALAFVTAPAEAGHARPSAPGFSVQAPTQQGVTASSTEVIANGVDAERAFQSDSSTARASINSNGAGTASDFSPLPASDDLDASATGEVRGRQLLRAMADLPQVGGNGAKSSLSLDFWDDPTSARSAVDDQAIRPAESSTQGNARPGAHSNVMIPLPMAAWSGLSVFGGVGFVAGLRRLGRRFR